MSGFSARCGAAAQSGSTILVASAAETGETPQVNELAVHARAASFEALHQALHQALRAEAAAVTPNAADAPSSRPSTTAPGRDPTRGPRPPTWQRLEQPRVAA